MQAEEFAFTQAGAQGEIEQRMQPMALGGGEELAGFAGGEGLEATGAGGAGLDVASDVAGDLFFEDGVFEGGFEDGVDVVEGQRGQQFAAAFSGGAAGGLVPSGVEAAAAALAGGAEQVEAGADVLGGEFGEFFWFRGRG